MRARGTVKQGCFRRQPQPCCCLLQLGRCLLTTCCAGVSSAALGAGDGRGMLAPQGRSWWPKDSDSHENEPVTYMREDDVCHSISLFKVQKEQ